MKEFFASFFQKRSACLSSAALPRTRQRVRLAEQPALAELHAQRDHCFGLLLRLDHFGDRARADATGEFHHGADEAAVARGARRAAHKRAIDLDEFDLELLQIAKGGEARAEI